MPTLLLPDRVCRKCGDGGHFFSGVRGCKMWISADCRECKNAYYRNRYATNPEAKARRDAQFDRWRAANWEKYTTAIANSHMKKAFGIGIEEYMIMFDAQGGVCAVCAEPPPSNKRLSVDHHHGTGKVRGLLCHHCNVSIGHLRDDPFRIRKLADYVEART
jgi:hypothetical protein